MRRWFVRIARAVVVLVALAGCDRVLGLRVAAPADALIDAPDAPPPPIVLVQQATAESPSSATSTIALPTAPHAGDLLVMIGGTTSGAVLTVTGGGVAQWTREAASDAQVGLELWAGVSDGTSAQVTIAGKASSFIYATVSEWIGPSTTLDAFATDSGVGTTASAPGIATTGVVELVVFAVVSFNTIDSAPAPGSWQLLQPVGVGNLNLGAWFQAAPRGAIASPSVVVSSSWDAVLVALRTAP